MLQRLRVREFVIVDDAEITFDEGFSVLTGETGAGKSILLDALGLLLGARADASVVREGAARADLTAEFTIDAAVQAWLAERDLNGDPGSLLLRRIVESDGRSKAQINGHSATATQLRELGESLLDIHGQHAAQSLTRSEGQRELLDAYGGLSGDAGEVQTLFRQWRDLDTRLQRARAADRDLTTERERVEWRIGELEPLQLREGEWQELGEEQSRLAHAAALIEGAGGIASALSDDDPSIASQLYTMVGKLRALAEIDPRLQASAQLLDSAQIQLSEAAADLSAYASRAELDPQRLAEVQARMDAVFTAARKLKLAPEQIPGELQNLRSQLDDLRAAQDVEALQASTEAARGRFDTAAKALSKRRQTVGRQLAAGIAANIAQLGMAGGKVEIVLQPVEPTASGVDRVEFRVAGHAGVTPRPLAKVASGGELSRIGLAIAVLAAEANPVPTLIFDEADAGVGGAVADAIGRLMRTLGQSRQVLCVTHLPQVAARAHQQYAVRKVEQNGSTTSQVDRLDRAERIEEVARMLGGAEITATTRRHARELLADAGSTG